MGSRSFNFSQAAVTAKESKPEWGEGRQGGETLCGEVAYLQAALLHGAVTDAGFVRNLLSA